MKLITEEQLQRQIEGLIKEVDALKRRIEKLESRPFQAHGPLA